MSDDRPSPTGSRRDPTTRFTDRAADYDRGRPGYPDAVFDAIAEIARLVPGAPVADVGAGTGISSAPLVERGYRVFAVEPNDAMRRAAMERLGKHPNYTSLAGTAEHTGLATASTDLVLAAQAFHWFDPAAAHDEWHRILRPGGSAALVWNARRATGTAMAADYEDLLLRFGTDYREVGHRGVDQERMAAFFRGPFETRRFDNAQLLDREGLRARLVSSSYVPAPGQPQHEDMMAELDRIFDRRQQDGGVRIDYDVNLYIGPLA
ncbi:MAG: class I SAM-dependent methyltransferase [Gemmatimonadota bacterium]|jgi:SAM-dependent methyltransferase